MRIAETNIHIKLITFLLSFVIFSCQPNNSSKPQFELLTNEDTGLNFNNNPQQTLEFNVFNYMYFFNGGGVSVGDFNNDGLQDVFFTNNLDENKLFLNKGNLKFEDVTEKVKMAGKEGWTSGTTVVDINNDGLLDIYVSQIGKYEMLNGKNQLYVCQKIENGIPIYKDMASEYGLDFIGFSTQAAFFDYDLDGDLDMYQLNHSLHQNNTFGKRQSFQNKKHDLSGDKLLRNDNGVYTDISEEANIQNTVIGYGLGIAVSDVNLDGWPDIYIGNDFHENDYLYINQKDGSFKETLNDQIRHTSRFSMGVDMADINNDGFSDIISLDMAPDDPYILKTSLGEDGYGIFKFKLGFGYNHQYARNNLQLNNGDNTFSEIGIYAGVDATDWSWTPLLFDFDHDGYKDLFVSNGIPRRMNDIDYIKFRTSDNDVKWKTSHNEMNEDDMSVVEMMPKIKLYNRFLKNTKDLRFQNIENQIDNNLTSFSNGAAYADFDNDGDLDVVVNNIEDEPFLYKNNQNDHLTNESDYVFINLVGSSLNKMAIGAKLFIFKENDFLMAENFPTKGYQSSVQNGLHIGLGDASKIDSMFLIWHDNTYEKINKEDLNKVVNKQWKSNLPSFDFKVLTEKEDNSNYKNITSETNIDFKHDENPFVEFNRETLIPGMVSREGPAVAVGDINGDGLEDIFFGGAKRRKSELYTQTAEGTFQKNTPLVLKNDSIFEDVDACMIDIENDGDLDLIIASGGNEYRGKSEYLKQRIYINDGTGQFEKKYPFEDVFMTASCVLPADFNNDGLVDLFFGGRAIPNKHGVSPQSYIFQNMGNGKFNNVTEEKAKSLLTAGMVKGGNWIDIDQDGDQDLVLAIEWKPIKIYLNNDGLFEESSINELSGWWNFVLPYDFDHDGDIDILAGNIGENSKLKPTLEEPVRMYIADFDQNKQIEQILTYYKKGKEIPFANYEELTNQIPYLKKKFLLAKDFAKASLNELFGENQLKNALLYEANTFSSAYFENIGEGLNFKTHYLPQTLQFSSMEAASIISDSNEKSTSVMIGGNFYDCNIEMGRYDANYGNILTIGADGNLAVKPIGKLRIDGQVKSIKKLNKSNKEVFLFGINDAPVVIISVD
ncbi:MAG: VCBS repeat-containing protein [Cyclobacteriaceae bacterium]|nr:VCBS repeat-containing protein [Cyclobacteriaceae bacterium]